jgi:hypothetical protein
MIQKALAALSLALVAGSCEESDAVSIRIRIQKDGKGTLTAVGLALPEKAHAIEDGSSAVKWGRRVGLVAVSGDFEAVDLVDLEGITFASGVHDDGLRYLRVSIIRDPEVGWARALVPVELGDEGERAQLAAQLDPLGRIEDPASVLKIEVQLPSDVVGHGISERERRLKETASKNTATLSIPLGFALSPGRALVWHLTWE